MMSINLSDIATLNIKGSDYWCIISLISKNEAINLMKDAELTEKSGTLKANTKSNFDAVNLLQSCNLIEKKWKIIK